MVNIYLFIELSAPVRSQAANLIASFGRSQLSPVPSGAFCLLSH